MAQEIWRNHQGMVDWLFDLTQSERQDGVEIFANMIAGTLFCDEWMDAVEMCSQVDRVLIRKTTKRPRSVKLGEFALKFVASEFFHYAFK
jgi:hypothetical protein